jgi:hypothetical protein
MRPKERRETGEQDLFRSRLDQIINREHALVKLAAAIDWRFLEEKFGAAYSDRPGHPPLEAIGRGGEQRRKPAARFRNVNRDADFNAVPNFDHRHLRLCGLTHVCSLPKG